MTAPRTVLVTGASSGFGAAVVRRFALDGARVVAAARRVDRLAGLAADLGADVLPVVLDVTDPGGNVYGATKAFVHQFSLNLRSDLHGTGVRVTCVEPGMAATEFSAVRFAGDQEKAEAVYDGMQPLTADDVADTIHWVATRPAHVNINTIELMPTAQSFAPFQVARG